MSTAALPPQVADFSFPEAGFGNVALGDLKMDAGLVIYTSVAPLSEADAVVRCEGFDASTSTPGLQKGVLRFLGKERLRRNPEVPLGGIRTSGTGGQLRRSDSKAGFDRECAICQPSGLSSQVGAA